MAHFAEIDASNIVLRVIVVNNAELIDQNGVESEQKGIDFCKSLFDGNWIQTSYNGKFRKNFAGVGYTYDQVRNAFIAPRPFSSWQLNEQTCQWAAPIPMPQDGKQYHWSEETISWVKANP